MITDKSYVHGNTARKLEYDVYEENKVLSEKKKQRTNNKVKVRVVVAFMAVFALCSVVMYRYALITEMNYKINAGMNALDQLKDENSILEVKIEKELDLQKIQQYAQENLGMQKPDKSQCVFVNVPRSDFTVVSDKQDDNLFDEIMGKVEGLTGFLY